MSTWSDAVARWRRISPRAWDVVLILGALCGALAESLARRHHGSDVWWLLLLAGLVGVAALWWRRRAPEVVLLVGAAVQVVTVVPIVLALGLYTVAVKRRDRVTTVLAVVAAAAFCVGSHWDNPIQLVLDGAVPAGFIVAVGAYVGARRDLLASLRDRAERAEAERELRAEQARQGERARIAREMHDVLAHKVSLIALHAGALEVNPDADREQVQRTIALIRATAHEAVEDLRGVLGVLRSDADPDAVLAPQPAIDDLPRIVAASRAAGLQTELVVEVDGLPDTTARTAYRVVQEGLTNVHKHARSAATAVRVTGDVEHGVDVEVVNQRPVSAVSLLPGSGAGLLGLRERVELVGGRLESGPTGDGGWRLAAWLPWSPRLGSSSAPAEVLAP